jgi:hypothetical protein
VRLPPPNYQAPTISRLERCPPPKIRRPAAEPQNFPIFLAKKWPKQTFLLPHTVQKSNVVHLDSGNPHETPDRECRSRVRIVQSRMGYKQGLVQLYQLPLKVSFFGPKSSKRTRGCVKPRLVMPAPSLIPYLVAKLNARTLPLPLGVRPRVGGFALPLLPRALGPPRRPPCLL